MWQFRCYSQVRALSRCLSHPLEPPTGPVVASGAVGALAQLFNNGASGDDVQLEALRCLTNIAADDHAHARTVWTWICILLGSEKN
jgi:hypothetical protein